MLLEITDGPYRRGQVWAYHTRATEKNSRVVIGRTDQLGDDSIVVHVAITGLHIANSRLPSGYQTRISHAPMSEPALTTSLVELTQEADDLKGFDESYEWWRVEYERGEAGVFTVPLNKLPELYEIASQGGAA